MSEERTGVEVVRSILIKLINYNYCTFQECIEAVEKMKKEPKPIKDDERKSHGL